MTFSSAGGRCNRGRANPSKCHSEEFPWAFGPPDRMKVAVILSEAKDQHFRPGEQIQILRFAQNDRLSGEPQATRNLALCRKGSRQNSSLRSG